MKTNEWEIGVERSKKNEIKIGNAWECVFIWFLVAVKNRTTAGFIFILWIQNKKIILAAQNE